MSRDMKSKPTSWKTVLLLCGKCGSKLDGGYGRKGKASLKTDLRATLKAAGYGRTVRVIETRCMGLCPKKAVTALNAGAPDRLFAVPRGHHAVATLNLLLESASTRPE
jgi:predicted metal-binding protein